MAGACASTGGVPRPFPVPAEGSQSSNGSAGSARSLGLQMLVDSALALRGVPYRNGGADPTGFDCSGFTQYVFAQAGIRLPRNVHDQFGQGMSVKPQALIPGDLVFFRTTGRGATHVGVVVNGDWFVHAPSSTGVVRVERLSTSYWSARFLGARRINAVR
jgi:cell wall-associated NlpC family hydrolase